MKLLLARCASSRLFLAAFLWIAPLALAALGYFAAYRIEPLALLALLTGASLYLNRFVFGTSESYAFVVIVAGPGLTVLPLKPAVCFCVALCGFVTGLLVALAALEWMDGPNQDAADAQARQKQAK